MRQALGCPWSAPSTVDKPKQQLPPSLVIEPGFFISGKRESTVTLELSGAGTFFTDNDELLGDLVLSQEPIYQIQGHLIYAFSNGVWVSLDATYFAGGSSSVDGVSNHDFQESTRYGSTLTLPLNRNHSIKLNASNGGHTRTGSEYDAVGMVWQYRFGAGL